MRSRRLPAPPSRAHGFVVLVVAVANALGLINAVQDHSVGWILVCSLILVSCAWMAVRDFSGHQPPAPDRRP